MDYRTTLVDSREGVNLTVQEAKQMASVIAPLLKQGHSPYQIVTNHPELGISEKTLYNYIENDVFHDIAGITVLDLRRQVSRKLPKKKAKTGSKAFSGVSPPIPGVLYSFTSLFRRTPYFPGVSLNLLVFLVFTRFYWSSPLFAGVPYLNHQIFFKLHQLFLKLPITFIAMLDASMVAPYFQCYD